MRECEEEKMKGRRQRQRRKKGRHERIETESDIWEKQKVKMNEWKS